ncbi:hypothetical protein J5N97_016006 [Dioscorea zingiberensis]|uniref:C3H1-type domain-containing protein n=1 Tax=Dioscorea zingiberensis TaxID=325984 RepID=A0A9D5HES2_9LILI|nr:hypothetical protein J5N97_016006 [Dioscorea zingiberensis]
MDDDHFLVLLLFFKTRPCELIGDHLILRERCPFRHLTEPHRRDLTVFNYSGRPCRDFDGVSCPRGLDCSYAHAYLEIGLHPDNYRKHPCRFWGSCRRIFCSFDHGPYERHRSLFSGPMWRPPPATPAAGVPCASTAPPPVLSRQQDHAPVASPPDQAAAGIVLPGASTAPLSAISVHENPAVAPPDQATAAPPELAPADHSPEHPAAALLPTEIEAWGYKHTRGSNK